MVPALPEALPEDTEFDLDVRLEAVAGPSRTIGPRRPDPRRDRDVRVAAIPLIAAP